MSETTMVLHVDDVGMCHGANQAFLELFAAGTVTSGSVMVPCPWFAEIAEAARDNPTLDLGVHLTLTAEKQHYRWGPLTRAPSDAGLTDNEGYFWRDVTSVRRHAEPAAVEAELRAQVERALAAGIDVTHLDAHMGAALAPEFCDAYVRVGIDYQLPVLLTKDIADYSPNNHLVGVTQADLAAPAAAAMAAGMTLFDRVLETDWRRTGEPAAPYSELLAATDAPMTFVCLHPNAPGELQFIEPGSAYIRVDEYELFGSAAWRAWLDSQPYRLAGMRELRDQMRSQH